MSEERPGLWRRLLIGEFTWKRLVRSMVFIYVVIGAFAWFFGGGMMFRPPAPGYPSDDRVRMLPIEGGGRIAARWRGAPEARLAILYSHGNAEDIGYLGPRTRVLSGLGVSVLHYDYPGYGRSEGSPSEEGAYRAIMAAYRHLVDDLGYPPVRIVLYGRSIGGGPTLWLAARRPVGGVVLESTFVSALRVATRWRIYPFDRFPNLENIRTYEGPLLIFHGTEDGVIAPWHGQALFDAATAADRRIEWIEGAGHNDLVWMAGPRYPRVLKAFLDGIRTP